MEIKIVEHMKSGNSVQEIKCPKNGEREIKYCQTRERGITHQTPKQIFIMPNLYTVKKLKRPHIMTTHIIIIKYAKKFLLGPSWTIIVVLVI